MSAEGICSIELLLRQLIVTHKKLLLEFPRKKPWEYSCSHWVFPLLLSQGEEIAFMLV